MAPPKYGDLGKAARDTFKKNYNPGNASFELKSKSSSGVEFKTTANRDKAGGISGDLETKYKVKKYGLTLTEKWTTSNVLTNEAAIEDTLAKGLKLALNTSFQPGSGAAGADVSATYKHCNLCTVSKFNLTKPSLGLSAVLGYENALVGIDAGYCMKSGKVTKSNFAFGYVAKDFTLHTALNDGSKVETSVHHKVNSDVSVAVTAAFAKGSKDTSFAVGGQCKLDADSSFKAKFCNKGNFAFSYAQKVRKGVELTLSATVDAKNLSTDAHKVGFDLVLEP